MQLKPAKQSKFTKILVKWFVKDSKEINNPVVKRRYGNLASLYALITNIILFILKLTFSFIFKLDTMRADAINNASDIGMCVLSLVIIAIAAKPASSKHPYGTARFEYIGSLVIAMLVIMIAFSQISGNIQEMIDNPEWSKFPTKDMGTLNNNLEAFSKSFFYVPFIVMIFATIVKITQHILLTNIGNTISSMALIATGKDARNDSMVSFMIALSLILSPLIDYNVDVITSIIVSVIVCLSGFAIAREAADAILGKAPSKEMVDKFVEVLKQYPIVLGIHDLEMNSYGHNSVHAYVHVEVNAGISILTIRNEIDFIQDDIEKKTGIRTVIHIDPILINDPTTDRFRTYVLQAAHEIDADIAVNDFNVIVDEKDSHNKMLVFDLILPYDLLSKDREVISKIKATVRSFTNDKLTFRIDVDDRASDLLLLIQDNKKI